MPEPITPEQIEVCRLRIEAERSFGTASVVESDTLLAIIAVCQRLMGDVLTLSAKLDAPCGAAVAEQEPMRIAPTVFMVETEENVGATLVRMIDQDGLEVYVGLDDHMRDLLVSMLVRSGGADV